MRYAKDRSIASHCPCGKSNYDGKFSPFEGFVDKGHCFSCVKNFYPEKRDSEGSRIIHFPTIKEEVDTGIPSKDTDLVLPQKLVQESMLRPERNILLNYLSEISTPVEVERIRELYQVGTADWWPGSTVFWQIDINGNVRTGKIIQYRVEEDDSCAFGNNCKRVKTNKPIVQWVHRLPRVNYPMGKQCFFGEHLLPMFPDKKIGVLESEKSALIASLYHPEYLWLACGGVANLNKEKLFALRTRDVHLFPDLKQLETWRNIATKFEDHFKYKGCLRVVDTLEKNATDPEKTAGLDLADYLLRKNWHAYNQKSG